MPAEEPAKEDVNRQREEVVRALDRRSPRPPSGSIRSGGPESSAPPEVSPLSRSCTLFSSVFVSRLSQYFSATLPPRPGKAEGCVRALLWCVHLGVDPVLQNPVSVPSSVFVRNITPPESRGFLPEEVAVTSLA